MLNVSSRRSFFTTVVSAAGLAALHAPGKAAAQTAPSAGPFDMAWLDQMKGKHKQLYDLGSFDLAADGRPYCLRDGHAGWDDGHPYGALVTKRPTVRPK